MGGQVSLIDGHIDNAERCVCCGRVIPEGIQYCVICGQKPKQKQRQIDRIRNMSVDELAEFMAEQVMQQEQTHLIEKGTTATHIEYLKSILFKGYVRYLESEVDTE